MAELEAIIERKLIEKLCDGDSQWTYRPDIRTEDALWDNFKYILEQNNKDKLADIPLSEAEFAKIKNDVSHATFYDAGKWLVGENGKVYVHVQRGNETLHLVVMNNEHIAGGTSVYEVINQYQSFKSSEDDDHNRRFDVTLLINGVPMIHIELKNKEHSYMEGFRQIKKYIGEGKFRGLFSNVQMFVVSNAVDTKYFSAARDTELDKTFLSGWLDRKNLPVTDYIEFADQVLGIPEAHEMVAKYVVLDNDKKRLLLLRPYQIHAIASMREASKKGESGFIWHTTGSGKTMTSYKATRNLLMDIPSIEKTIFLIDRKDLDIQTKMAFQSYAENDSIDVDETERVDSLIQKLTDGHRQMIVTTRQKMQVMIDRKLEEGSPKYEKIKKLKVAFVVDECHRAVTPETKRNLEQFFNNSLWYGFTGTPIFEENKYEQKGDLPQTTEQLYGKCLHSYTIKEAIHDEAVLGFMIENLGPKDKDKSDDESVFDTEKHMRSVLDVVLNQSYEKLGMQNPKGETYEAILTVNSIARAQKYYDMLVKIKNGEDELKIDEKVHQALPDFPRFAITYSVTENEEASQVNQDKMKVAIEDYNDMFSTNYTMERIAAYNANLNDRLARKEKKYLERSQQLDLVIVVDRLLTGFDAPCLSTVFMDRKPMTPQNIIQTFSRTNRLFDGGRKQYGQIVTFQYPDEYKEEIDKAIKLYSRGGDGNPIAENWDTVLEQFSISLKAVQGMAPKPEDATNLSRTQKKAFVHLFRALDHDFHHLKCFSKYDPKILDEYGFSQEIYEDYAAAYNNIMEELKKPKDDQDEDDDPVLDDYDLVAYNKMRIDFEYIVELLQGVAEFLDQSEDDFDEADFYKKIEVLRVIIDEYAESNPKQSLLFKRVLDEMEEDKEKFVGKDISVIINEMRYMAIESEIKSFAKKWYVDEDDVKFGVYHYANGEIPNESVLKEHANYREYEENTEEPLKKFRYLSAMINEFRFSLMPEIEPLLE